LFVSPEKILLYFKKSEVKENKNFGNGGIKESELLIRHKKSEGGGQVKKYITIRKKNQREVTDVVTTLLSPLYKPLLESSKLKLLR